MRASESHPNFKPKLREYANYSVREIRKMCKDIGPRLCGSPEEEKAQAYVADELKKCADKVDVEKFEVHPGSFYGWFTIAGVFGVIAVIALNIGLAAATLSLCALAFVMLVGQFLFYKPIVDIFFKKKTSNNVSATRKASAETKRHIIICGHIDSCPEWNFSYRGGRLLLFGGMGSALSGLIFVLAASIAAVAGGQAFETGGLSGAARVLGYISIAFVPSFIGMAFFTSRKLVVEGANDNLTGVFAAASVLKYLSDCGVRFEHTDVTCLSTGGEEAGLRGAKAYAKQHKNELDAVETLVIAVDTLKDYDDMAVMNYDMTFMVKNNFAAGALVRKAGESADVDIKTSAVFVGASDAAAFSEKKIPATALAAMNPGPPRYYHTRLDKPDILDIKTIEKGIEVLLETVFLFDEDGLAKNI
ncbi:MAG: M28 family metallopeptidase [Oscillospiraceae bacterium]|nr:M28 family metallopeptidase [Oscillospiraceae bacterium]